MKTLLLGFLIGLALAALAFGGEPRHRGHSKHSKNYILRRQQTYQVQGVPDIEADYRQARDRRVSQRPNV